MRVNNKVELLLKANPRNRDSDKELLLAVWELEGLHFSETQKRMFMDKCTSAESITRARRAMRESYPPSEEVDKSRFNKFLEYKYKRPFEYVVRED
jgi:hypothetical protein